MKLLIATKDDELRNYLTAGFYNKHEYVVCDNGQEALNELRKKYDLVILDENLDFIDPFILVDEIKSNYKVPSVLFISKYDEDKIRYAYYSGFNDVIVKENGLANFVLKVDNYARLFSNNVIVIGGISIDLEGRVVSVDNNEVKLTSKEFELLNYLIQNKGKVVSRKSLIEDVWKYYALEDLRTIDTHIKKLRNALGPYKNYIETYRGVGYKFEVR